MIKVETVHKKLEMTSRDKQIAMRIIAITIGIVLGIVITHNSLCVINGNNCEESLAYLL